MYICTIAYSANIALNNVINTCAPITRTIDMHCRQSDLVTRDRYKYCRVLIAEQCLIDKRHYCDIILRCNKLKTLINMFGDAMSHWKNCR